MSTQFRGMKTGFNKTGSSSAPGADGAADYEIRGPPCRTCRPAEALPGRRGGRWHGQPPAGKVQPRRRWGLWHAVFRQYGL